MGNEKDIDTTAVASGQRTVIQHPASDLGHVAGRIVADGGVGSHTGFGVQRVAHVEDYKAAVGACGWLKGVAMDTRVRTACCQFGRGSRRLQLDLKPWRGERQKQVRGWNAIKVFRHSQQSQGLRSNSPAAWSPCRGRTRNGTAG